MAGYSRTRTFTNNETINADDFTTEFDNLTAAFNGVSGHDHSGGTTGKSISMVGNTDGFTKITANEGTNELRFYTNVSSAAALQFSVKDGVIEPNADSDVDIGTTAKRFKDLYVDSATVTGTVTAGGLTLGDNDKLQFGDGSTKDLQIYHNSEHSIIEDVGTGNLIIRGASIELKNASNKNKIFIHDGADGSVKISHGDAETATLETTATGIDVTGEVKGDSLTIDNGSGDTNGYIASATGATRFTVKSTHDGEEAEEVAGIEVGAKSLSYLDLKTPDTDDYDLRIYHSEPANHSMIDSLAEDLFLRSGGKVALQHAGANTKLETTATGINVTGTVNADAIKFTTDATDNAKIFTVLSGTTTALVIQSKDDADDSIILRCNTPGVGEVNTLVATNTGIDVTGAITVSGTVDGRDIAADGILLDAIEAGADVTDTANVVAALTAGDNITIAGNGTITATDTNTTYLTATSSTAGLVKIGYVENNKNYPVELSSDKMFVNVPWTDSQTAGTGLSLAGGEFSVNASQTQITSVGALGSGTITSGFGSINVGSDSINTTGFVNAGTVNFPAHENDTLKITSSIDGTASHLEFWVSDDLTDTFKFMTSQYAVGGGVQAELMTLKATATGAGKALMTVDGQTNTLGLKLTSSQVVTSIDTDLAGVSAAHDTLPTALAVKTYVDAQSAAASDGDITSVVAGTGLTDGGTVGAVTLNVAGGVGITANANDVALDLSELTTSTANADGDFFAVVDTNGAQKKLTKANIALSGMNNDSGWTSNAGTVTAVTGVGAITSTGGVTPAIGLTLNNLNVTTSDANADLFPVINDSGTQYKIAKGTIKLSGFDNDANFSSTVGTVTGVTVGTGLDITNGTTTPAITLSLDEIAASTTNSDADKFLVTDSSGAPHRIGRGNIALSDFNDDLVYTNNAGTVTAVSVGTGLDISNASTTPSISLDLTELTASTTGSDAHDIIALTSGGTLQKVAIANIPLSAFDGTIPQGTVTGVSATAPLTSSGGTTPTIALPPSTGSVDGYMSSEQAAKLAGIAENATAGGGISAVTVGTGLDVSNGTTAPAISLDLSELTLSTTDGHGDYFVVTDTSNVQRKLTKANIALSGFNNDSGYTTNAGTVTSVGGGTGTTSSGGATPSISLNLNELIASTGSVASFAAVVGTSTRKVAPSAIPLSSFNNDSNFSATVGTVTSVSATAPVQVINGTTAPAISIPAASGTTSGLMTIAQADKLAGIAENATAGTAGPETITAGSGLNGGGSSGTVNLAVNAGDGIQIVSDSVAVDNTVIRTTGNQSIAGTKTFMEPVVISTDSNDGSNT